MQAHCHSVVRACCLALQSSAQCWCYAGALHHAQAPAQLHGDCLLGHSSVATHAQVPPSQPRSASPATPPERVGDSERSCACAAPEVVSADRSKYDGKLADMWSCGVMLYVMLFHSKPCAHVGHAAVRSVGLHCLHPAADPFASATCTDVLIN